MASHACLATFSGHAALVSGIVCHLGWCVTASHDQALRFWPWGAADAQPAARALHHAHQSAILALSHVRGLLVSSAADGSVCCWDMETGMRIAILSTCAPKVLSLLPLVAPLAGAAPAAAGPGGSADADYASLPYHLCSGDGAGILKLWKLERSSTVAACTLTCGRCESCKSSWAVVRSACTDAPCTGVAGVLAEVVGAMPATAGAADQSAGDDEREVSLLEFLAERAASESVKAVQALALAPQQRLVAAAGDKVSIWHLPSARSEEAAHCRLGGFQYAVTALAASEQGVFAGTSDGQIHAIAWQN